MKKSLLTLTAFSLLATMLSAQQPVTTLSPKVVRGINPGNSVQNVADTVTTYLDRATQFYNLSAGSSGYVLGTSNATLKTGCHYSAIGSSRVTELMVYFAHKTVVGTPDNVSAGLCMVSADSMPTTLVSSGSVSVSNIDTSGFPTFIPMSNYFVNLADFFVYIDYGTIDDTISIMSTNPTALAGGPDGADEKRVRQNTNSISWSRAYDLWTIGGQPYNADALILPIVDIASGVENAFTMNGFTLQAAFPSPAVNTITLPYSVSQPQQVKLFVYNQQGQTVVEQDLGVVNGAANVQLDVSAFAAGTYYYVLSGAQGQVGSRFVVE